MPNATAIKHFFRDQFGLTGVRVTSNTGFVKAWIPATLIPDGLSISWPSGQEFPVRFRQICLGEIYGYASNLARQTSAGNVEGHSIAMSRQQWQNAMDVIIRTKNVPLNPEYTGRCLLCGAPRTTCCC